MMAVGEWTDEQASGAYNMLRHYDGITSASIALMFGVKIRYIPALVERGHTLAAANGGRIPTPKEVLSKARRADRSDRMARLARGQHIARIKEQRRLRDLRPMIHKALDDGMACADVARAYGAPVAHVKAVERARRGAATRAKRMGWDRKPVKTDPRVWYAWTPDMTPIIQSAI